MLTKITRLHKNQLSIIQGNTLSYRFWLNCFFAIFLSIHPFASIHAAEEWREASTDHFIIYADAPEKWLRNYAERLERFDSGLRFLLKRESSSQERSNRLVIYVVENEAAVANLCGDACSNAAGFYVSHIGEPIAFTPRNTRETKPEVILFHEYTHHLLLSKYSFAYPKWVSEGLAEFNSNTKPSKNNSLSFGQPAQHRANGLLAGMKMPIDVILDPGTRRFNKREEDIFYGRSWLLVHYLKFEESRRGQFEVYLQAFNSGKSSLEAAQLAFGDLSELDKNLDRYVSRNSFTSVLIPEQFLSTGSIAIRTLTDGEAATMGVRMRSKRGVNEQQALELVPEGRRIAATFPNDSSAQTALAEIELDAGNLNEAEIAADRALAANPAARDALLYKGIIAMQRLSKLKSKDESAWIAARSWFAKANRLDNNAARPLFLFYLGFLEQGIQPTENAAAALKRAFDISPQDGELRWVYAQYLLNTDKTMEARSALLPLAYDPHQSGDNAALKMVRAIDAGATGVKVFDAISTQTSETDTSSSNNK